LNGACCAVQHAVCIGGLAETRSGHITVHSTTHGVLLLVHNVVCFTYFCLMAYLTTPCHATRL